MSARGSCPRGRRRATSGSKRGRGPRAPVFAAASVNPPGGKMSLAPLLSPRIGILFVLFRCILEARRCTASSGAALRPAKNQ
jgi:hypothetical protein